MVGFHMMSVDGHAIDWWKAGAAYIGLFGLIYALLGVLIDGVLAERSLVIEPSEVLTWSLDDMWRGLIDPGYLRKTVFIALVVGLVGGGVSTLLLEMLLGSIWVLPPSLHSRLLGEGITALYAGINLGMVVGLGCWTFGGYFKGWSSQRWDRSERNTSTKPNEGILRSAQNSFKIGWMSAVAAVLIVTTVYLSFYWIYRIGLLLGLQYLLVDQPLSRYPSIMLFGLLAGLLIGLLNGGIACIQHVMLRWLLKYTGAPPKNYVRFLDYAVEHILLRKRGGGYSFVHNLFLEHFANPAITRPEVDLRPGTGEKARSQA